MTDFCFMCPAAFFCLCIVTKPIMRKKKSLEIFKSKVDSHNGCYAPVWDRFRTMILYPLISGHLGHRLDLALMAI